MSLYFSISRVCRVFQNSVTTKNNDRKQKGTSIKQEINMEIHLIIIPYLCLRYIEVKRGPKDGEIDVFKQRNDLYKRNTSKYEYSRYYR